MNTPTTTKPLATKPAAPKPAAPKPAAVTPEVTLTPVEGIVSRPLFATTVEDAPVASVPEVRQLSPKTLAEQAAGRAAISQY